MAGKTSTNEVVNAPHFRALLKATTPWFAGFREALAAWVASTGVTVHARSFVGRSCA